MSICANPACGKEFERKPTSKRTTCSRSCAVALSWRDPKAKAARSKSIKAQKATPEARQQQREQNERLWADPKQHERLSEWNRQRWADPTISAQTVASIKAAFTDERKAAISEQRRAEWADPEIRAMRMASLRRAFSTPEWRAQFSERLKARWRDPIMREKYIRGITRFQALPANRQRLSAIMKARWADPEYRERSIESIRASIPTRRPQPKRGPRNKRVELKAVERRVLSPVKVYNIPQRSIETSAVVVQIRSCKCGNRFRPQIAAQLLCIPCIDARRLIPV
jgi:hypothetical protein